MTFYDCPSLPQKIRTRGSERKGKGSLQNSYVVFMRDFFGKI